MLGTHAPAGAGGNGKPLPKGQLAWRALRTLRVTQDLVANVQAQALRHGAIETEGLVLRTEVRIDGRWRLQ